MNDTPRVHELVAQQAARHPDRIAVEWDSGRLTYAELVAEAAALAHLLSAAGAGPGGLVGLLLPRSPGMIVALVAILQTGAAYVPVDHDDAPARQRMVLADAGVRLLLTAGGHYVVTDDLPGVRVIDLDRVGDELSGFPRTPPRVPGGARDLAYISYTSGSTGRPKGVQAEHGNVVHFVSGDHVDHAEELTFCLVAPLAFDASTFEIWTCLCNGHRLVVPPAGLLGPDQIGTMVQRHAVTVLHLTKGLFNVVMEAGAPGLRGIRLLFTGGDKISPVHARQAVDLLPDTRISNCYGPTETTTFTTLHRRILVSDTDGPVPIGLPVTGARIHVLDAAQRPVSAGEVGELYVGGPGVARGYTDPALTAERFLPDPFDPPPGADRMYRTGDLVRRRPDGSLMFVGRVDNQVKIRGHRVEPGEVEHVLATLSGVRDVCCVARRAADGESELVAYVVSDGVRVEDIRAYVDARLPPYLRPAFVELLDELPLSRNGKVDYSALPEPSDRAPETGTQAGELTPTEKYLATLWQDLLGRGPTHSDEDFFAAGGHSLTAMRFTSRLRHDLGKRVSLAKFFAHTTLRSLGALLDSLPVRDGEGVRHRPGRDSAPLSPFQHGLWIFHQLYPGTTAYHVPMAFEIAGALDVPALERALAAVVARHDALRTTITVVDGEPVQRISARLDVRIERAALPSPGTDGEDALRRRMAEAVRQPIDLTAGPLWRMTLYSDGAARHALLLVVHHLVTDGWSMELLKRDLSAAYQADVAGVAPSWPQLSLQFADVAEWEAAAEGRARAEREKSFWLGQLAGVRMPLQLPTRVDRPDHATFTADEVAIRLRPETTAALRSLARAQGVSLFSVLFSGFALMLSRVGGQRRFTVGSPLAVRDDSSTKDVVGFFNNTMVLPCAVDPDESFVALAKRTHRMVVEALAHRHVPFESLVAELVPDREPGKNPLFDVWFNMLSYQSHPLTLGAARVRQLPPPLAGALFDLTAYVDDGPDGIDVRFVFNPDVLLADRVAVMLAQTVTVFDQIGRDPSRTVDDVPLGVDPPGPAAVAEAPRAGLLDRAAGQPGHRTAVEQDGRVVSYDELLGAARRSAAHLTRYGVAAGDIVALATGRTPELLVGMVAARSVGAAFTTLDPGHPEHWVDATITALRPRAVLDGGTDTSSAWIDRPRRHGGVPVGGSVVDPSPTGFDGPVRQVGLEAAYVLQTSGSTGRPLYVVGAEAPLVVFFEWYSAAFGLGPSDRFSVLAGLSHDPLLRETLLPLWLGATACLPPATLPGPAAQLRWLVRQRVTVVHLTPGMLRLLAAAADGHTAPDVRLVALGGAAVTAADHRAARALFPRARRISFYGTTETPQGVSLTDLDVEFAAGAPGHPPLGGGSPSAELGVLRAGTLRRAATNEVGEVYVRSPYLALGYAGDEELTAARFVDDPWNAGSGSRLYRTGDWGRLRPDGSVEFLGRLDDQLAVDGHRVEPAEIEAALTGHLEVLDCCVTSVRGRPTAAVRLRDPAVPVGQLHRHLAERVPPALLVTDIVVVDRLPLTPNGKVDRPALTRQLGERSTAAEPPPAGQLLTALTDAWRATLGKTELDPDRTFFELGGTSAALLRLHRRLTDQVAPELTLVELFRYPTLRTLAAALAVRPAPRSAPLPLGQAGPAREAQLSEVDRIRLARQAARATRRATAEQGQPIVVGDDVGARLHGPSDTGAGGRARGAAEDAGGGGRGS
ncbi:non-ribosomal peptide synthetase [Micromonospora eburnea]|uniref:Amino acid adenylation domain-containing protein n=1 Tax=Micromonospora eburnea TaxID=227316 RepID=A0A1C6V1U5_9ACTN|nr:non-ribosomal peptide synthetase [Micromonospora eburnea]SCL60147.1 amino acid adenylation domain-containing protein [Micromonospora eburnea]